MINYFTRKYVIIRKCNVAYRSIGCREVVKPNQSMLQGLIESKKVAKFFDINYEGIA